MEEMVTSSAGKPRQCRGSIILNICDEAIMQLPDKIHGATTVAYGQSIVLLAALNDHCDFISIVSSHNAASSQLNCCPLGKGAKRARKILVFNQTLLGPPSENASIMVPFQKQINFLYTGWFFNWS